MGLYGDNIFVTESLDSIIAEVEESSKIFTDFNINESVGSTIKQAIKNVIERIHKFIQWIKTTVKNLWNKLRKEGNKIDPKKTLQNVENEIKNEKDPEVKSKKSEELEKVCDEKILVPYFYVDTLNVDSLFNNTVGRFKEENEDLEGLYYLDKDGNTESPICEVREITYKELSDDYHFYLDNIDNAEKVMENCVSYFKRQEEYFKKNLENTDKNTEEDIAEINELLEETRKGLSNCTIATNYAIYTRQQLIRRACNVNAKRGNLGYFINKK